MKKTILITVFILASLMSIAQQTEDGIVSNQAFDTFSMHNHYHKNVIDLMIDSVVHNNLDMYLGIQRDFITSHDAFMAHIYSAIALLVTILVMMFGLGVPYLINKRNEERLQESFEELQNKSSEQIMELTKKSETRILEFAEMVKQQIEDWESSFEKKDTVESSEPEAKTDPQSDNIKEAYRLYEEKKYIDALRIFQQLSKEGNSAAQNSLGDMYYFGYGVEKDYNKALAQYESSAKQENRDALYNLGIMYMYGNGVEVSRILATKYFAQAAEKGSSISQRMLGDICLRQNENEEALHWYNLAAENGDTDALRLLGYMYEKGVGVSPNENRAITYYKQAESKGDIIARRRRQALEAKIPFNNT